MRLYGNRGFEYACASSKKTGIGKYAFDRDVLEITFEKVVVDGRVEKGAFPTFRAKVSGSGNAMRLAIDANAAVVWKRVAY